MFCIKVRSVCPSRFAPRFDNYPDKSDSPLRFFQVRMQWGDRSPASFVNMANLEPVPEKPSKKTVSPRSVLSLSVATAPVATPLVAT